MNWQSKLFDFLFARALAAEMYRNRLAEAVMDFPQLQVGVLGPLNRMNFRECAICIPRDCDPGCRLIVFFLICLEAGITRTQMLLCGLIFEKLHN